MLTASATKCLSRSRVTTNCRRSVNHRNSHPPACKGGRPDLLWLHDGGERDLFRLLVNTVSGIGPKLGLAVLSGMSVHNFKSAVVNSDVTALSKISGLGKKTAERIVLELKEQAWRRRRLGSSQRCACAHARDGTRQ